MKLNERYLYEFSQDRYRKMYRFGLEKRSIAEIRQQRLSAFY